PNAPYSLGPIHDGHLQIRDNQVDRVRVGSENFNSLRSIASRQRIMTGGSDDLHNQLANAIVVVCNEDHSHFRLLMKVSVCSGAGAARSVTPLTILYSPRPMVSRATFSTYRQIPDGR